MWKSNAKSMRSKREDKIAEWKDKNMQSENEIGNVYERKREMWNVFQVYESEM